TTPGSPRPRARARSQAEATPTTLKIVSFAGLCPATAQWGWLTLDKVISTWPPDRPQDFLHKKRSATYCSSMASSTHRDPRRPVTAGGTYHKRPTVNASGVTQAGGVHGRANRGRDRGERLRCPVPRPVV